MKISTKGRYALAAALVMAEQNNDTKHITLASIAESLGLSKIYLEQVFSLLRRGGIVRAIKGARGGYQLAQTPEQITVFAILSSVENGLFQKTEQTVAEKAPQIEEALQEEVFERLDRTLQTTLEQMTLADLVLEVQRRREPEHLMFYI